MNVHKYLATSLLLCACGLVCPGMAAKKVRLSHKVQARTSQSATQREREARLTRKTLELDSVTFCALRDSIGFSGYDKTAQSAKESFFVTNRTGRHVCGLKVGIEYRDMSGRMLHQREVELEADIPHGETRMVTVPTFDLQRSLYYHRSRAPRNGGMAFDVVMKLKAIRVPL